MSVEPEPGQPNDRTLTVVIHGTWAKDERWWRLGDANRDEATFADNLECALSSHGMAGTVWRIGGDHAVSEDSFKWTGRNRHRDRRCASRQVSSNLDLLAKRSGSTDAEPLVVNFVAHSHGGNVVLDTLTRLSDRVRVGRVVLLGTPLVSARPALRLARFVLSIMLLGLLAFFFLADTVLVADLVFAQFDRGFIEGNLKIIGWIIIAVTIPYLVCFAWSFWLIGNFLDVLWRLVNRLVEPFYWMRGRTSRRVYGPSARRLAKILHGDPILMLTGYNDEADLALQISSAPDRLYSEFITDRFATHESQPGRKIRAHVGGFLERLLLRPFVLGAFLRVVEVLSEKFVFGFSSIRALFTDYEVVPFDEQPYYPPDLLAQTVVEARAPAPGTKEKSAKDRGTDRPGGIFAPGTRGLRRSVTDVMAELKAQIKLRHSAYYESPDVIGLVARFIATGDTLGTERPSQKTWKAGDGFWELVLLLNILVTGVVIWRISKEVGEEDFWANATQMSFVCLSSLSFYPWLFAQIGASRSRHLRTRPAIGFWLLLWGVWLSVALFFTFGVIVLPP